MAAGTPSPSSSRGAGAPPWAGDGLRIVLPAPASICKRDRLTHPAAVVACYPLLTQHHRYRQQPLQRGLQRPPAQHVLHVRHHRCRLLLWYGNGERCSEADSGGSVCWAGWRVCSAHLVTSFASPELECGWRKSKRVFCLAFGVFEVSYLERKCHLVLLCWVEFIWPCSHEVTTDVTMPRFSTDPHQGRDLWLPYMYQLVSGVQRRSMRRLLVT